MTMLEINVVKGYLQLPDYSMQSLTVPIGNTVCSLCENPITRGLAISEDTSSV